MNKLDKDHPLREKIAEEASLLARESSEAVHVIGDTVNAIGDTVHELAHESEAKIEGVIFQNRALLLISFAIVVSLLAYMASKVSVDIAFNKLIPTEHSYIVNAKELSKGYRGDTINSVRVSVGVKSGDIYTQEYLDVLKHINDDLFYLKGVDRGNVQSLWTANTRWLALTPEGYEGGTVIPSDYNGSQASINTVKTNILRSSHIGSLVANDFKSTIVKVPLVLPSEGRFDYQAFSHTLEEKIREKYSSQNIEVKIVGFPKWIADLVDGFSYVGLFFSISVAIAFSLLMVYTRCIKSSFTAVVCSVIAVACQLGLLRLLGFGLDPYTVLVPFLVFAVGISHGVQVINGFAHNVSTGLNNLQAAKLTFGGLYIAGSVALISDAIGFLTLLLIEVEVIRELAIAACLGVSILVLTNLVLLPLLMSYIGVSQAAIDHVEAKEGKETPVWNLLSGLMRPKYAIVSLIVASILLVVGLNESQGLKIGDLKPGQPMLRPDSQYNLDNEFITNNYSTSSDQLVVFVKTAEEQCTNFPVVSEVNRLQWKLQNTKGVLSAESIADLAKMVRVGTNEGSPKWLEITRDQYNLTRQIGLDGINRQCSVAFMHVYLTDHKAETLQRVLSVVEDFNQANGSDDVQFLLGGGNAGIAAATNQVIDASQTPMLLLVYSVVALLCWIAFRSIRAVICIITPLALTSVLCQALMANLDIGVKVATLPVIALGVGIGVDYGIYIFDRLQGYMERYPLRQAYLLTLKSTGKAVFFTGLTLALGVATWIFSPIQFQADMGILLTFMFLWNMIGAMWLLPSLACLLYGTKGPAEDDKASELSDIECDIAMSGG